MNTTRRGFLASVAALDKEWDRVTRIAEKLAKLVKYASEIPEDAIIDLNVLFPCQAKLGRVD